MVSYWATFTALPSWRSLGASANHIPVSVGTVGYRVPIFIVSLSVHIGVVRTSVLYVNICSFLG